MVFNNIIGVNWLKKSSIAIWTQLQLVWWLLDDLAFKVDGWEHWLHEKYKTAFVSSKVVIIFEKLDCLFVIDGTCHNHELAFLDLWSQFITAVSQHLCFEKSFSKNLENRFATWKSNIIHALGMVEAKTGPLASCKNDHRDFALLNQGQAFIMVCLVLLFRHVWCRDSQVLLDSINFTLLIRSLISILNQIFVQFANDFWVKTLHFIQQIFLLRSCQVLVSFKQVALTTALVDRLLLLKECCTSFFRVTKNVAHN